MINLLNFGLYRGLYTKSLCPVYKGLFAISNSWYRLIERNFINEIKHKLRVCKANSLAPFP